MQTMSEKMLFKKMQRKLFWLGLIKFPMVGFLRPKLLELNDKSVKVKIPLSRRSKNHLNSMYFGALAVGADLAGGLQAFYFEEKMKLKLSFAFKRMKAEFIKRAESDVIFMGSQGSQIQDGIVKSKTTGERINIPLDITAINSADEKVAFFEMVISVKVVGEKVSDFEMH